MAVSCADFRRGKWEIVDDGKWVIDRTTGRKFANDSMDRIQCKAATALGYGIVWNSLLSALCLTARTVRIVSCFHFWKDSDPESNSDFTQRNLQNVELTWKERCKDLGIDVAKCVGTPFFCIAEQCLIFIAVAHPSRNHKKYINAVDRLQFDGRCYVICSFKPEEELRPAPQQELMADSSPLQANLIDRISDRESP